MEKTTPLQNDPSGIKYEINIYKYWKGGFCLMGNRICSFKEPLNLKRDTIVYKHKDYFFKKEIELLNE